MSQFSNTPLLAGSRPQGGFLSGQQLQNAITTESTQVFNVPAVGAINQGNNLAELRQAFGLAGQVVQAAGQISAQERAARERAQAKNDELAEAFAAKSAGEQLAQARVDIESGAIVVPPGAKIPEFAASFADELAAKSGEDEAYRRQFARLFSPRFAEMLGAKVSNETEKARAVAVSGYADKAVLADNPDDVKAAVTGAEGLLKNRDVALAQVVLPAMRSAAAAGEIDRVEMLASVLPEGRFAAAVKDIRADAHVADMRNKAATFAAERDTIERAIDNNTPAEILLQGIDEKAKAGTLAPGAADVLRARVTERESRRVDRIADTIAAEIGLKVDAGVSQADVEDDLKLLATYDPARAVMVRGNIADADARRARAESERLKQDRTDAIIERAAAGSLLGQPLGLVEDVTFTTPDGKTHTVKKEAIVEDATNRVLSMFDRSLPPDQARARGIAWAAGTGTKPGRYSSLVDVAPALGASVEKTGKIPDALAASIAFYEQAKQSAGAWVQGIGSANGREYLDAVVANLRDANMTPVDAVTAANRMFTMTPDQRRQAFSVGQQEIEKTLKRTLPSTVRGALNYGDVTGAIVERARTLATGTNRPADALKRAASDYAASYVVLGNFASPTNQEGMTDSLRRALPEMSSAITRKYAKDNGENAGGLSLVWSDRAGAWQIVDALGIAKSGKGAAYSVQQLAKLERMTEAEAEKAGMLDVVQQARDNAAYQDTLRREPLRDLQRRYGDEEGQRQYDMQQKTLRDDLAKMYPPEEAARILKELGANDGVKVYRMSDKPPVWSDQYEQQFKAWYAQMAYRFDLDPNPDDPQHHYNYRMAFFEGVTPDAEGHWPSRFKDAAHPNRIIAGVDTITGKGVKQ